MDRHQPKLASSIQTVEALLSILILVSVAYVAALVTTIYPASQAAATYPAEALRYE